MQHQRQLVFLFVWGLLFLTSCIPPLEPETVEAATAANSTEGNDNPAIEVDGNFPVPKKCVVKGYQTFITREWEFCFAYPTNVYVKQVEFNADTSFRIILGHKQYSSGNTPSPSDTLLSTGTGISVSASGSPTGEKIVAQITDELLEIACERVPESSNLQEKINEDGKVFQLPFVIGNEAAQVLGKTPSGEEDDTGLLDHVLCVKHGDTYCELKYKPDLEISFVANQGKKCVQLNFCGLFLAVSVFLIKTRQAYFLLLSTPHRLRKVFSVISFSIHQKLAERLWKCGQRCALAHNSTGPTTAALV